MSSQLLISGVIFGLSIGSIFFLMAIGLSLCFGLMRIISLDQLLYYSIGAYLTYTLSLATGSVWLGVLGGLVVAGIAAFAVERLIFRRIYERELTFSMITSFGILIGGVLRVDCRTETFRESVRKIVLEFVGTPPDSAEVPGLVSYRQTGTNLELVLVGYDDAQREAVERLRPQTIEVLDLNLEDAFIEYTRGSRRSLPLFATEIEDAQSARNQGAA